MAKRIALKPEWIKAKNVVDIYSTSSCISEDFADYVNYWRHNGFWLFDSPEIIEGLAREHSIDMNGTTLFYYEVYEFEFDESRNEWRRFQADASFMTNVTNPIEKCLEGYDVVTFSAGNAPECSPLSCNGLAEEINTNEHCLLESFEEAKGHLEGGRFNNCEPGPYRIFAVYSLCSY